MIDTKTKDCSCETKQVEKACDCGGNCGSAKSESSESLAEHKERLEQELKDVDEQLRHED